MADGAGTVADRTRWLVEDRFGLFIHWGIYAAAARHEWVKSREKLTDEHYQRYFDHFDPDLYDPAEWADAAWQAGMRYFVITTKHHDGFCLWDSELTDYKATNTPYGRDLLRAMVDAFRARGFKVGFYHSLLDWHHPEFPVDLYHPQRDDGDAGDRDITKYAEYLHGQVRELLTNYGRIDVMWFDFSYPGRGMNAKGRDDWQSEKLLAMVRELQPHIIVNNRLDLGAGDLVTPEQVQPTGAVVNADEAQVPWEACQTLNGSWGYDRDNLDWKPTDLLVRMLIDGVSKGGNLLLNVGPTARGEFEPRALERLAGIGEWMRRHERSIRGAGPSGFVAPPDCRYTQVGNRLYLHLFAWPMRHVHLAGLAGKVAYAQLLHDASEIQVLNQEGAEHGHMHVSGGEGSLTLELPIQRPDVAIPVVELFLKES
ncbi:alpha-L-fucosidase [Actinocatenispora rupis]|uniref:alpha-L-fucosidase n=1 Tax=Actinocatenispora rupis TaxID=519421 RepID=A0A8J3NCL5_9ACTN|nr:alpha-L-fucosidase [Actinocatenispora rupis]GID10574.1 alpha-L-fucosidase [Actinocatenispora rupis]